MTDDLPAIASPVEKPSASLYDVYRWIRPVLDSPSRRALRLCCTAAREAHDREEPSIHARTFSGPYREMLSPHDLSTALVGILARGCRPDRLSLWLEPRDSAAQERGMAALDHFLAAGASSVTQLAAQHFNLTAAAAAAVTTASPGLASLRLTGCAHLPALPSLVLSTRSSLRILALEGCGGSGGAGSWPADLGPALESCPNLEHLTLLLPAGTGAAGGSAAGAGEVLLPPIVPVCEALPRLTQLRSLSLDLRLPSCDDGDDGDDAATAAAAAVATPAAAALARGFSALTRLSSVDLGEAGSLPHPEWRLGMLHSLAGLPRLSELSWRRLECDPEALFALAPSTSLTSLSVEKFRTEAPLTAVALAAAAAAEQGGGGAQPPPPVAAAAAAAAARPAGRMPAGRLAATSPQQQQQLQLLLLPLPPRLQQLTARYSGLGGVSLAALAALQLPPGLGSLVLRNPKLEIADGDVDQPAAARLLPEAALALGMGISKLAVHCPDLSVLRIMNETPQRNALVGPVGWADANGGSDGGTDGGGHAPWLASLGKLRSLRRLTLSGLRLGRLDAEALARHVRGLEDLYMVPMGSVSSDAVPVLRGMGLRRMILPYERHA